MTLIDAAMSMTLRLKQVELDLQRALGPELEAANITFEHWQVIAALLEEPGLRMTELATASVLPVATLTRHIDRLVEQALVTRRIDTDDQGRAVMALSAQGEQLALRLHELELQVEIAGRVMS